MAANNRRENVSKISVLLLEDSQLDAELTFARLRKAGLDFTGTRVDCRKDFEAAVCSRAYDVILADYALPDFDGIAALSYVREHCPDIPFIMVSGVMGEEHAIDALHHGAR